MNYYYDILINLSDNKPYEFYEWMDSDPIEHIKKIPILRVKSKVIKEFLLYDVILDKDLLNRIFLKTEMLVDKKVKKQEYMLLLTDTKCALVIEADMNGKILASSKLLLTEELNLLEIAYAFDEEIIYYTKGKKRGNREALRIENKIKKFLTCEINTLYERNIIDKLKYIYYEWTNKLLDDEDKLFAELNTLINQKFDLKHYEIYKLIKLSYQLEK